MDITSRDNRKISEYIRLRDKASERESEGLFTLEGARLVMDALKENAALTDAFYTDQAAEKYPEVINRLKENLSDHAHKITPEISKKLCDTVNPQGVYAVAQRLDKFQESCKIVDGGKYLVLNGLQDPGNVGTILRCADAVGIDGVYVCGCCDIYSPKTVRSTMGSLFRLKIEKADYFPLIENLRSKGVAVYASVVSKDADILGDFDFPATSAVVIGNEGNGLNNDEINACARRLTIKMKGTIESLNAASAASIILWELTREGRK